MHVRVIEIIPRFFKKSKQVILKDGNVDLIVIPSKDDIVFIDDVGYKVLQRDIIMRKNLELQRITLFVEKLLT